MKIFEIREYNDGGPQDRGDVIGYAKEESLEIAREKHKKSNWIEVREITSKEYYSKKEQAEAELKMFTFD
jgi:hypothetical protein